jgi:hypothetical protein
MNTAASAKSLLARITNAIGLDRLSPRMRKVTVGTIGSVLLLVGLAMIVLPGPAVVFIPLGLAILAMEFKWARRCLDKTRVWINRARKGGKNRAKASTNS